MTRLPPLPTCTAAASKLTLTTRATHPPAPHLHPPPPPAAGLGASWACSIGTEAPPRRQCGREGPAQFSWHISIPASLRLEGSQVPNCRPKSPGDPSSVTSKLRALSELAVPSSPQDWATRALQEDSGHEDTPFAMKARAWPGRAAGPAGSSHRGSRPSCQGAAAEGVAGAPPGGPHPLGAYPGGSEGVGGTAGWEAGAPGLRGPDCRDNLSPQSAHRGVGSQHAQRWSAHSRGRTS